MAAGPKVAVQILPLLRAPLFIMLVVEQYLIPVLAYNGLLSLVARGEKDGEAATTVGSAWNLTSGGGLGSECLDVVFQGNSAIA